MAWLWWELSQAEQSGDAWLGCAQGLCPHVLTVEGSVSFKQREHRLHNPAAFLEPGHNISGTDSQQPNMSQLCVET